MQRKGQFLWNELTKDYDQEKDVLSGNHHVGFKLWNLSNKEFDKIMKKYSTKEASG